MQMDWSGLTIAMSVMGAIALGLFYLQHLKDRGVFAPD
jgi:hypothetical protein